MGIGVISAKSHDTNLLSFGTIPALSEYYMYYVRFIYTYVFIFRFILCLILCLCLCLVYVFFFFNSSFLIVPLVTCFPFSRIITVTASVLAGCGHQQNLLNLTQV